MAFRLAALFCLLVVTSAMQSEDVVELGENKGHPGPGPTGAYNANAGADEAWGRAEGTRTLNMPGPAYGNPGYKESHNWEQDTDAFAPVVFNGKFYQAMYAADLGDKSDAEVRKYWVETALADTVKYPDCPQGSSQFSINMYYRANPSLAATTDDGVCKMVLEDYLKNGIYDGKPTFLASAEASYVNAMSDADKQAYMESAQGKARAQTVRKNGKRTKWPLNRSNGDMGVVIDAQTYYSYTMWFKLSNAVEKRGNILQYGDNSPKISLAPNYGKYLEVISAQSNSNTWGCNTPDTDDFRLQEKEWTHIGVVVEDKKLTIYLNGVKAQECTNDAGEARIFKDKALYVPANEPYADGKITGLKYWGGCPLNAELIAVEHSLGPQA